MTKTEKEYFKVYEIYGIRINEKGKWVAFNRDYLPLGRTREGFGEQVPDSEYPTISLDEKIEQVKLDNICYNPNKGVTTDKDGRRSVFLYTDSQAPWISKKYLNEYNARLKKLENLLN